MRLARLQSCRLTRSKTTEETYWNWLEVILLTACVKLQRGGGSISGQGTHVLAGGPKKCMFWDERFGGYHPGYHSIYFLHTPL